MPSNLRRAYFTIHPGVLAAAALLLAVCVWSGWMAYARFSELKAAGAVFPPGYEFGFYAGLFLAPLIVFAVAGGVAAAMYFLAKRSQAAANAGLVIVFVLGACLYGYRGYRIVTAPPQPVAAAAKPAPKIAIAPQPTTPRPTGSPVLPQTESPPSRPQSPPALPAPTQLQPNNRQPAAAPTPTTPPTAPAPVTPAPTGLRKPAGPPPKDLAALPAYLAAEHPAALQPLQEAATAIQQGVDKVLTDLTPTAAWAVQPKRERKEFDKRQAAATALKTDAAALETLLQGTQDGLADRLVAAGVPEADARTIAVRFGAYGSLFERASAAERMRELAEACERECTLLLDNLDRWSVGKDGRIESKDAKLRSEIRTARFRVEAALRSLDIHRGRLEGR